LFLKNCYTGENVLFNDVDGVNVPAVLSYIDFSILNLTTVRNARIKRCVHFNTELKPEFCVFSVMRWDNICDFKVKLRKKLSFQFTKCALNQRLLQGLREKTSMK